MIIGPAIQLLLDGHHLSREDARELMGSIMDGEGTHAQIAGFLVALRTKGETADEIAGFAEAMREHVVPVTPQRTPVVDIVGTGGDGVYAGLPAEVEVGRYHSLAAAEVPPELVVTSRTADGEVMGVRHAGLPVEGVQFHPESVLTPLGPEMARNFLR